jgi:hypothetical protein
MAFISVVTTPAQRKERLDICEKCEHKIVFMNIEACGLCKCPLGGKTTLKGAKCPADKWPVLA